MEGPFDSLVFAGIAHNLRLLCPDLHCKGVLGAFNCFKIPHVVPFSK